MGVVFSINHALLIYDFRDISLFGPRREKAFFGGL